MAGANVNDKDAWGKSALYYALEGGSARNKCANLLKLAGG
jgi:hypothetical protein